MAHYKRQDANHHAIKKALKDAGRPLHDASYYHGFGCDLVVEHVDGRVMFLEIKVPGKERKLTDSELALQSLFPGCFHVVTTVEQALAAVGLLPRETAHGQH